MGVTTVLQFAVTDVRTTKSAHRKTIAETEVEIWYTLFLVTGKFCSSENPSLRKLMPGAVSCSQNQ